MKKIIITKKYIYANQRENIFDILNKDIEIRLALKEYFDNNHNEIFSEDDLDIVMQFDTYFFMQINLNLKIEIDCTAINIEIFKNIIK